jgi:hypothetical protein
MSSTHRTDSDLLRDVVHLVDVDLVERDAGELLRQLLEDRRDDAARPAPRCPEVDDGRLVAVDLRTRGQVSQRYRARRERGVRWS